MHNFRNFEMVISTIKSFDKKYTKCDAKQNDDLYIAYKLIL